jgi:hypothetical protein
MGCFHSKQDDIAGEVGRRESSSSELSLDYAIPSTGRVGISPSPITTSSSSDEESIGPRLENSIRHRCPTETSAAGFKDEWSVESIELNDDTPRRHEITDAASYSNQSMDDLLGDESVVDWLAESNALLQSWPSHEPTDAAIISYRPGQHPIVAGGFNLDDILAGTMRERRGDEEGRHVVKDTRRVERRHAPLPIDKPSATSGSWLTNRYVVNDYIVLSEIGKGAHADVRLCKHKITNEIYAVKIMNRKLLGAKFVDVQKEVAIMKTLIHPNSACAKNIKRCVYLLTHLDLIDFSTFQSAAISSQFCVYMKSLTIRKVRAFDLTFHAPKYSTQKTMILISHYQSTRFI